MSSSFSPPVLRNMTVLDREKFRKSVPLTAAKLSPRTIPLFKQHCKANILDQPRIRSILDDHGDKLILLRDKPDIDDKFLKDNSIELVPYSLDLTYDYWQADDILRSILPESLLDDSPAGFTMVGHIAHMNLREEYLPYKHMIGQIILDKNSSIRTVVNKLDTIDSVYRNFQMEVIAGDNDLIATQHESGCRFRFDFSKVYWNSRLHTEHERLVAKFKEGQAVCDVMAGVGPFAIPAAKKNVVVFANDLNPASYEALVDNIQLNKVQSLVIPSNIDGREFIRTSSAALEAWTKPITIQVKKKRRTIEVPKKFDHYVMNLPATAIEFLDAFKEITHHPTIHVHCFTKFEGDEARDDMTSRIKAALGREIRSGDIDFHHVRRVAPNKDMYCCSFVLG